VKREKYAGMNVYIFELTLGIHTALGLSAGELSTLIVDGLFILEDRGLLFPGVTEPEDRLRMAGMQPIGYQRSERVSAADGAYRQLSGNRRPPTGRKRELKDTLDEAVETLGAAMLHVRMLAAKMTAASDKCSEPGALKDADRASADALLTAAQAIIAAVEASAKPVL
jgi:hypothetical protein